MLETIMHDLVNKIGLNNKRATGNVGISRTPQNSNAGINECLIRVPTHLRDACYWIAPNDERAFYETKVEKATSAGPSRNGGCCGHRSQAREGR